MKKAIFILLFTTAGLFSQIAPEWVVNYPLSSNSSIKTILNDNAGYFYALSHSNVDSLNVSGGFILLTKINNAGTVIWKRFYSRPGIDSGDFPVSMVIDNQNNIYILDASHGYNTGIDLGAVKYDQDGTFKWDYFYTSQGGIDSYDSPASIFTDSQGNCYLTGFSSDFWVDSIITIKLNTSGSQQWVKTYITTATRLTTGMCITTDNSMNVYVGGTVNDSDISFLNAVILKYNSSGVFQWSKKYSGSQSISDWINNIKIDNAGNIIAAGAADGYNYLDSASVLVQKYTQAGNLLWTQVYHTMSPGGEMCKKVLIDNSDNIYILCNTQYYDISTLSASFILKYNTSGSLLWNSGHGNYYQYPVFANNISFDNNSNILVTGKEKRFGRNNLLLVRFNSATGVKDLVYLYNRTGSSTDAGLYSTYLNNSLFVTGRTDNNLLIMKMTPVNTYINTFRRNNLHKLILDSLYTYDTIYLNTDQMPPEAYLKSINFSMDTLIHGAMGDIEITLRHGVWEDTLFYRRGGTFDNMIGTNLNDSSVQNICSGGIPPFTGYFAPCKPLYRHLTMPATGPWILKIFDRKAPETGYLQSWALTLSYEVPIGLNIQTGNIPENFVLYQNYPNPFNPITTINYSLPKGQYIKLSVYDINGKEIEILAQGFSSAGNYENNFDGTNYASGVYFYRLQTEEFSQTGKMVLIK